MRKLVLIAALAAVFPATAFASEPVRFQHAGVAYEYVVTDQPDGSRLITGRNIDDNRAFKLLVRGRRVTGTVGDSSVAFSASRIGAKAGTRLASN